MDRDQRESHHFLRTYSRDVLTLKFARNALLSHPKRPILGHQEDAAFCRILMMVTVSAVESVLDLWHDNVGIRAYFATRASNEDRVRALKLSMQEAGVSVDENVLFDFLAIKYLRNTYVHANLRDSEREWISKRGFPTDFEMLTAREWERISEVATVMLRYVEQAVGIFPWLDQASAPEEYWDLADAYSASTNPMRSLVRPRDVPSMLCRDLEIRKRAS